MFRLHELHRASEFLVFGVVVLFVWLLFFELEVEHVDDHVVFLGLWFLFGRLLVEFYEVLVEVFASFGDAGGSGGSRVHLFALLGVITYSKYIDNDRYIERKI